MLIRPVAVTYERIPQFELIPALIEKLEARAKVDAFTCPLVVACDSEVGLLCSLPDSDSVWRVLVEYSNSQSPRRSLNNFLAATRPSAGEFFKQRITKMWERLKIKAGF